MPRKRNRSKIGVTACWLLAFVLLDLGASVLWLAAAITTERLDRDGEAVAVLWGDEEHLSTEGERRLRQTLAVWQRGEPSRPIFCVGGTRPVRDFLGARVLCDWLGKSGIPLDLLRIGAGSNDTVSNLREIGELARATGVRRVLVVTDPLQAMRIRLFLEDYAAPAVLRWAPYQYGPLVSTEIFRLWIRVQQEFAAVGSLLVPAGLRQRLIDRLRP